MLNLKQNLNNYIVCGADKNDPEDLRALAAMLNGMADELDPIEEEEPVTYLDLADAISEMFGDYKFTDEVKEDVAIELLMSVVDSLYK